MNQKSKVISPEELARQQMFSAYNRDLLLKKYGRQPLACPVTFGCQQNEADTELIRGMLVDMGYGFTDQVEKADFVLFNTCAIREHAEQRVFGNVGEVTHLKKHNPSIMIAVCGCMAQQQHIADKLKASYPGVDLVFGTHALCRLPELMNRRLRGGKRVFDLEGDQWGVVPEGIRPIRKEGPNAWLSIMYGCNNFCTYCIVPHVRGRERSRTMDAVLADFKQLVAEGYKDITLLGQNVNSYGKDLPDAPDFATLLENINAIPGDFRVRFMTSHPKDASPRLFDVMARCEKVCNSIHLPVQAGNNRVLKEMNRHYTREQYLELVRYARSVMPDLTITSDIIVGFPGETEEEFEETLSLLREVRYDSLFTFIYSPRKGTKAAEMPDPVSRQEKQVWFDRLLELQNTISREKNDPYVGKTLPILLDGYSEDENYTYTGRTEGFKLVHVKGPEGLVGQCLPVEIDRRSTWALFGKVK